MIQLYPYLGNASGTPMTNTGTPLTTAEAMGLIGNEQRDPWPDRPWVYTNMITSADGATAIDGLSGRLGSAGDRLVFRSLRASADVILVGAGTVRQEQYRAPKSYDELAELRRSNGQNDRPRLAVVTTSFDLDPELPLFEDPDNRPFLITGSASPDPAASARRAALSEVAEIIEVGIAADDDNKDFRIDLSLALRELHRRGVGRVLCEGGPTLNGQLIALDLIDEWNLSLAPMAASGESSRAAVGPLPNGPPTPMTLQRVWTQDDYLFCRWSRAAS